MSDIYNDALNKLERELRQYGLYDREKVKDKLSFSKKNDTWYVLSFVVEQKIKISYAICVIILFVILFKYGLFTKKGVDKVTIRYMIILFYIFISGLIYYMLWIR